MKGTVAIFIIACFGITGCRKETPLKHQSNVVEVPYSGSSDYSSATCGTALVENEFTTTPGNTTSFSFGEVDTSTATGVLIITAQDINRSVTVTFGISDPAPYTTYTIVNGTPGVNEVKIEYDNGSWVYTGYSNVGYSDVIHLNKIDGWLHSVEFCDVYMESIAGEILGQGWLTRN